MNISDASSTTNHEASSKTIVCVYSHTQEDESFYRELRKYLIWWERKKSIQWLEIPAGSNVEDTMQAHLQQADIILLLISPDFLDEDYCFKTIKICLQESEKRQVHVVPILARVSAWKATEVKGWQSLPRTEPIAQWPQKELAYEEIRVGLERFLPDDDNGKHPVLAVKPSEREVLLRRVKSRIEDVLEPSLKDATVIPLELHKQPDLMGNSQHTGDYGRGSPSPAGTSITEVYDKSESVLLILGEPGSGKTILLLQLAKTLLDQARRNPTCPMPVVFNLSTWTLKRRPLVEWFAEELETIYGIPQKLGKVWIASGELLFLLDGLDEVAAKYRDACVSALNTYLQQQRKQVQMIPLIIGSRLTEYRALPAKLAVFMGTTVIVQKPTDLQIREYLGEANEFLEGDVQELLRIDPRFRDIARNPLMLNILKRTYQGKKVQLERRDSPEEQRRHLFADYVERMLEGPSRARRYSPDQTKHWLIWLAKQMKERSQTGFYIEDLQLDWLGKGKSRPVEISTSLVFGFLTFLVVSIVLGLEYTVYGLKFAVVNGILAGSLSAFIAFLFALIIETNFRMGTLFSRVHEKRPVQREEEQSKSRTKLARLLTPLFWERAGFALLGGLLEGLGIGFWVGHFYAVMNGLFFAAYLLVLVLGELKREIRPAERLVFWTWKNLQKNAVPRLLVVLGVGALMGLLQGYIQFQQWSVFLVTLYFWLSLGGAIGIIFVLLGGFSSSELDKKQKDIKPNQGIRNSLFNSLLVGLSSGTLVGVVVFFFYSYVMHHVFRIGYIVNIPNEHFDEAYPLAVSDGVAIMYLFWMINGGIATIQHLMLRIRLWKRGNISWHYARFLEYTHDCLLLRRVGGGYMFVHKLLLEYFADLDEGAYKSTEESKQPEAMSLTSEHPGGD